jgi:hypothetical protein
MEHQIILRQNVCLNCHADIKEEFKYCPNCGQQNTVSKVPLKFLIKDFLTDYFTFDSKFFKSIIPLLIKPGSLTTEFSNGKRVKYVQPIRLYLMLSILLFFILSIDTNKTSSGGLISSDAVGLTFNVNDSDTIYYENLEALRKDVETQGKEQYLDSMKIVGFWDRLFVSQIIKFAFSDKRSVSHYLMNSISVMMFFLLPFFAILLKLFFNKNKHFYVEHLVFSIHLHSFIFILLIIFFLINVFVELNYGVGILLFLITLYTILALKKVYDYSFFKTLKRFTGLFLLYHIGILFVFVATAIISLLLF